MIMVKLCHNIGGGLWALERKGKGFTGVCLLDGRGYGIILSCFLLRVFNDHPYADTSFMNTNNG